MVERLEKRTEECHRGWLAVSEDSTPENLDSIRLKEGEVEPVEAAILELSKTLLGDSPPASMWDSISDYAKRNYMDKGDWVESELDYFRWFLIGIQRTQMFLDYLEGFAEVEHSSNQAPVGNMVAPENGGTKIRSVFISYGGPDERFAIMLNDGLRRAGVNTFFFPDDAPPGAKLHAVMRDGVNEHDHVVLICSRDSLDRSGVANELEETLQREAREGGRAILIPVTIDDYVFSDWASSSPGVAQSLRDRVVADFRDAIRDPIIFERSLGRVVAVLLREPV